MPGMNVKSFINISPVLEAQNESECGARAALYAIWFARDRTRGEGVDALPKTAFLLDVAAQMEAWRKIRVRA